MTGDSHHTRGASGAIARDCSDEPPTIDSWKHLDSGSRCGAGEGLLLFGLFGVGPGQMCQIPRGSKNIEAGMWRQAQCSTSGDELADGKGSDTNRGDYRQHEWAPKTAAATAQGTVRIINVVAVRAAAAISPLTMSTVTLRLRNPGRPAGREDDDIVAAGSIAGRMRPSVRKRTDQRQ